MSTSKRSKRAHAARKGASPKSSFVLSLAVHALVLTALFVSSSSVQPIQQRPSGTRVVQKSTTVNTEQLQQEIAKVKKERLARITEEKRRVQTLQSRQASLQRKLSQKEQALSKQEKRLARLKVAQQKEQQQLKSLQVKQVEAEKNFTTKQKVLASTEQKLKKLRLEQQAVKNAVEKQKLAQEAKQLAEKLKLQQLAAERAELQRQRMNEGIIDRYRARILTAIQQQWIVPKETKPVLQCKFLVQLSSAGVVQQVQLLQSSGSSVLDRSARIALLKASPLPIPENPALNKAFRSIRLAVRPNIQ